MGNVTSSSDSDEEGMSELNDQADYPEVESITGTDNGETCSNLADLNQLFTATKLRNLASKIKETLPVNPLNKHRAAIVRWLDDRETRNEEIITVKQFCEFLSSKEVPWEDAMKAYNVFDTDGTGVTEIIDMQEILKSGDKSNTMGALGRSVRALQACAWSPGFVDVYAREKYVVNHHGNKILEFLWKNHVPSREIPFIPLNGYNNISYMRMAVLKNLFEHFASTFSKEDNEAGCSGDEMRPVTKCYNNMEVSSNSSDVKSIEDDNTGTYWQSDGSARSHWLKLRMKSNIIVKSISIYVMSLDQSYMPELVSVSVGSGNSSKMRELKEVRIASHVTGDVIIAKNLKTSYPVIQINIKRCQSDGCDTRIRNIKIVGYRVVKESGFGVMDASAVWYMQMLTSTVRATSLLAPTLKNTVLEHTKNALQHIPPLSFGPSAKKPKFISRHLLQEIGTFIDDMFTTTSEFFEEGFGVALTFSLAQGHVGNIVKTLKLIQENKNVKTNFEEQVTKINETRIACWEKYCHILKISDSVTDGRQKLEASLRDIIVNHALSNPSSSFITEELQTPILNAFFFPSENIQLTKIKIKVVNGEKAPKQALVFVYNKEEQFCMETDKKKFEEFDNFFSDAWEYAAETDISQGCKGHSFYPVAHVKFKTEDEETEVTFSSPVTGNAILIKFWGVRGNEKSMGLSSIKFIGFPKRSKFLFQKFHSTIASENLQSLGSTVSKCDEVGATDGNLETHVVKTGDIKNTNQFDADRIMFEVLSFLVDLTEIQAALKRKSCSIELLDVSQIPIETLWQICKHFSETKNVQCELLILNLIHNLIPYLSTKEETTDVIQTIFKYVCSTIDNSKNLTEDELQIYKQLIINGAPVFFPDKDSRKKQLFNMMKSVDNLTSVPSVTVVFQSLCHFYSNVDPSGLLELPEKSQTSFDDQQALSIMDNVLIVAVHEISSFISSPSNRTDKVHLIHLINSLQTTLLSWCENQLKAKESKLAAAAENIIHTYVVNALQQAIKCVKNISELSSENLHNACNYLENSFLGSTVRQFILHMMLVNEHVKSTTKLSILKEVFFLIKEMQNLSTKFEEFFPGVSSAYWENLKTTDTDLRVWERESLHNYENNLHITETFSCPGAARFIVDFDPRCETERRYDFLEFTDSNGLKVKYDQTVGSAKWPLQVIFGGPFLNFLFQSDNSNSEWGYKFKVTARGSPDITLPWLFDLQLGAVKLFGQLCGSILSTPCHNVSDSTAVGDEDLLQSDLWSTLFRGGYLIGKLQRSLSGKFMAESSAVVLNFLTSMIDQTGDLQKEFITKCKEQHKGQKIGGEAVDRSVLSVFAALVWHTQQLQENLEKYIVSNGKDALCDGIYQAYSCAESIRLQLIQQRQQYNVNLEDKKSENLTEPIEFTKEKAHYLLKFPGLKKTQLKSDLRPKSLKRKKSERNIRSDPNFTEKFQSFRLVLEFVQDSFWTIDRVHKVLQDRAELSVAIIEVYQSTIQFLKVMNDKHIFQIPVVLFFQELLNYQEKFPHHYSKGLEGCGLLQEAKVRSSFYEIIKQLSSIFHKSDRKEWKDNPSLQNVIAAYDFIQASFLHLITVQWKPFDLFFIADIKLPELLLKIAKETVKIRNYFPSDQEEADELKEYNKYMNWFDECSTCSDGFLSWYNKKESLEKQEKKEVQMFIARYCDLLDVEITCDGCGVTLPGRRYRCLQCVDMDLCATCFASGVKPAGEHTDEHDIVHLVFKCNQCQAFIVGERFHCDECDDFDLCLGCHKKGSTPSGHKPTHSISKIPMMKLRNNKDSNSHMQAYIHQHVWLLFASLSLSMVEFILDGSSPNLVNHVEYLKWGNDLYDMCVNKAKHYLKLLPDDADEQIKHFSEENSKDIDKHQEMAFAIHSQERIVSLIGAMIKQANKQKSATDIFLSEDFFSLLFVIIHSNTGHEFNTQHLSMGILQQLLRTCTPTLADDAIKAVSDVQKVDKYSTCEGYLTVQCLVDYGSAFLKKSDLGWSCSISRVLHTLLSSPEWSHIATKCLHSCISDSDKENANRSIYALFVIAGFPDVPTIGSCVEYNKHGLDTKEGIVLKHYPDKSQSLVIDVCSRKRYSVADQYTHMIGEPCSILETETVQIFVETVRSLVNRLKSGSTETVGNFMVLALSLKGLNTMLKNASAHFPDTCKSSFVQSLVYLASKGTGLSQQWLLRDLEILSLMMYTHNDKENLKKTTVDTIKNDKSASSSNHEDDSESDESSDDSSSTFSLPSYDTDFNDTEEEDINAIFKGVDVTMKLMLEDFHKEIKVPLSVLKAIFEMNDKNTSSFLKAISENFEGHTLTAGEDIKRLVQKWDKVLESGSVENVMTAVLTSDQVIDTGMVFHPSTININHTDKANPEPTSTQQKLIKCNENEVHDEIESQRRTKSAELLKKAVSKQGRKNTDEFAIKVNQAIAILYARQVLTSVLAQWLGTDVEITAELLGCKEIRQIPCILDLLNRYDDKDSFHKVVEKVIQYVEVSSLPAVAKSACQFLEETTLSAQTIQSAHSYEIKDLQDELKLQGASFLTITFESICATKEDKDELIFSTSADFQEERHVFSGTSKSNWSSFQVPGDTLYYKFSCSSSSSDGLYGYSFTVTAGTRDSFDTGYTILGKIFKEPNYIKHIPLSSIWSSMVYVSCKETGTSRLKTFQLMLLVLKTQRKACKADSLDIDLCLLKPLWLLYCTMTSEDDDDIKSCVSPVVRALTELFIEVEILASEWGMELDYVVAVQETECLRKSIGAGILNVAYVSQAIDYKNCVVDFVTAIQQKRASSSLLKP